MLRLLECYYYIGIPRDDITLRLTKAVTLQDERERSKGRKLCPSNLCWKSTVSRVFLDTQALICTRRNHPRSRRPLRARLTEHVAVEVMDAEEAKEERRGNRVRWMRVRGRRSKGVELLVSHAISARSQAQHAQSCRLRDHHHLEIFTRLSAFAGRVCEWRVSCLRASELHHGRMRVRSDPGAKRPSLSREFIDILYMRCAARALT